MSGDLKAPCRRVTGQGDETIPQPPYQLPGQPSRQLPAVANTFQRFATFFFPRWVLDPWLPDTTPAAATALVNLARTCRGMRGAVTQSFLLPPVLDDGQDASCRCIDTLGTLRVAFDGKHPHPAAAGVTGIICPSSPLSRLLRDLAQSGIHWMQLPHLHAVGSASFSAPLRRRDENIEAEEEREHVRSVIKVSDKALRRVATRDYIERVLTKSASLRRSMSTVLDLESVVPARWSHYAQWCSSVAECIPTCGAYPSPLSIAGNDGQSCGRRRVVSSSDPTPPPLAPDTAPPPSVDTTSDGTMMALSFRLRPVCRHPTGIDSSDDDDTAVAMAANERGDCFFQAVAGACQPHHHDAFCSTCRPLDGSGIAADARPPDRIRHKVAVLRVSAPFSDDFSDIASTFGEPAGRVTALQLASCRGPVTSFQSLLDGSGPARATTASTGGDPVDPKIMGHAKILTSLPPLQRVAAWRHLRWFEVSGSQVDLSEETALAGLAISMPVLEVLRIPSCRVQSTGPLVGCTELRELDLRDNPLEDDRGLFGVETFSKLQRLNLSRTKLVHVPYVDQCPALKTLSLEHIRFLNISSVNSIVAQVASLEELRLASSYVIDDDDDSFASRAPRCDFGSASLAGLFRAVSCRLRRLDVRGLHLGDSGFAVLTRETSFASSLTALDVSHNPISSLAPLVVEAPCRALRVLNVTGCRVSSLECLAAKVAVVSCTGEVGGDFAFALPDLRCVDAGQLTLSEDGLQGIDALPSLELLSLLNSHGFAPNRLGRALRRCPALTSLDLSVTAITDAGLDGLEQVATLRTLRVAWCRKIASPRDVLYRRFAGLATLEFEEHDW